LPSPPQDHEIFRLRDEVLQSEGSNATFYTFLAIPTNANNEDINRAYRKLSRTLHPDKARSAYIASYNAPPPIAKSSDGKKAAKPIVKKNKQPSPAELKKFHAAATARFERLSLVTNVLRGPERERYDHFLRNGFPAWRGTGYYYERFRPGLGTVLIGLFIFAGGAVHYVALWVGWKRQREFVERYISHARRMAWGQEGSLSNIPGLGGDTNGSASPAGGSGDEQQSMQWNRKQKREMEKQKKKEGKPGFKSAKAVEKARTEGISSPVEAPASPVDGPVGAKKRTVAENGKVLIVDSVGNVFLEEETEEGERKNFLLDVSRTYFPTLEYC
jgi:curved DNA-binding protein CbpA